MFSKRIQEQEYWMCDLSTWLSLNATLSFVFEYLVFIYM